MKLLSEENPSQSQLILYQTNDGKTRLEVRLDQETVWLTLNQMADLFQRDKSVISRHIRNVFEEGELQHERVVAKFAITAADGKTYQVDYYNLDVIISVGYRVKSHRGTQFRIWATQRLREYIVKGFTLDDERLKQAGGGNYFDELLARIRDIRSSEKVFWRKVLDIYATSIDYEPSIEMSQQFFATVQNKMQAQNRKPMYMRDWIMKLDDFLKLSEREILTHFGKISHEVAVAKAKAEYEQYHQRQLSEPSEVEKHFEAAVEKLKQLKTGKKVKRH